MSKTVRTDLRHAVVPGQDEVDLLPIRKLLQPEIEAVHQAVHPVGHLRRFGGNGAVDMAGVVRLVEIDHQQARAFLLREAHQAHGLVHPLLEGPVGLFVPVAPVGRELALDGDVAAQPVDVADLHATFTPCFWAVIQMGSFR